MSFLYNYNMKNIKDKKRYLIVLGPLLLVIILSLSYAYWRIVISQTGISQIDTLRCLSTSLTDLTNSLNLVNEYPISNSEGMKKEPYTFRITNECDIFIHAHIALEVLPESTLSPAYVRGSLNPISNLEDNSRVLTNYEAGIPTIDGATSHIMKKDILINPNDFEDFDLRLWVDEATTTEEGANRSFSSKIVVTVSPTPMPVNLIVNLPSVPIGQYTTDFAGAVWDHKTASLKINSVSSNNQNINLINNELLEGVNFSSFIIGLGTSEGVYNEPVTDYRYQGKNPNNYLNFNGELWRIIGVFSDNSHGVSGNNLVKIIRDESLGGLTWDKNKINNWENSSLNKLLNEYYYLGLNEPEINYCYQYGLEVTGDCDFQVTGITNGYYRKMIENVTWYLGGVEGIQNVNVTYEAERAEVVYPDNNTLINALIGLMYPSDYGYSALEETCPRTTLLSNYHTGECGGKSWLIGKGLEWTITPHIENETDVFRIYYFGNVNYVNAASGYNVRPALYLKNDVLKIGGTGTYNDPYIVSLNL